MPTPIKLALSLIVAIVAAIAYYVQADLGHVGPKYAIALLALFMLVGMWIFPEVKRREGGGKG